MSQDNASTLIRSSPDGMRRTVVITGTFDVRNYGDLLFPLVAAYNLEPAGFRVRAASPVGKDTGWKDTFPVQSLTEALLGEDPLDGILIGGGNIVHVNPVKLSDYVDSGVADWAYPRLWLGATLAAAARGVPVAWNAPGVPGPLEQSIRPTVDAALTAAAYLSVRDTASAASLDAPKALTMHVCPDPVLQLAEIWPKQSLADEFRTLLERSSADPEATFIAVHAKERSLRGRPESLAITIEKFCKSRGVVPILIGIGACHGDDIICQRICAALDIPHVDMSRPGGLREIAAAIAHCAVYMGASMHGYITAAAYGVPGAIVGRPRLDKVAGLLGHLERRGDEARDWDEALGKAAIRLETGKTRIPDAVSEAITRHWSHVRDALSTSERQVAVDRTFLEYTLKTLGRT